jgi:hypothetical protein
LRALVEPKANGAISFTTPRTMSNASNFAHAQQGVSLARSATLRFERLSDRLELLMLNKTKEFIDEKEALISTASFTSIHDRLIANIRPVLQHYGSKGL